ncbi:MAG TPA: ABC transporter substrate-binding protein [Caulobacteraceae bacterium]|jgi:iron complex transport system substrate-binding protein
MTAARLLALICALAAAAPGAALAGERVYSLDQCADQYVLALVPRGDIAALSPRADDHDSYLRRLAGGLPKGRAALEPVLASRAHVVVRYWGGDLQLMAALRRRRVRVVTIDDAQDFAGVRRNVRSVAQALGRPAAGEALVKRMDGQLERTGRGGGGRNGLYLTSGGFTAGPDTLIGAMLAAAGWRNAAGRPGFQPVRLERLVISPPQALALGYFDPASLAAQRWAFGRHRVVRELASTRPAMALPSSILGCPAWFAADGPALLARWNAAR